MNKLINVKNLNFAYNNAPILKDINFSVNEGDFIGIIGRNGSGKSTFLKLLIGELKPLSGEIELNMNNKIGYVEQVTFSNDYSFPANVLEIVLLGLYSKIGLFRFANSKHKKRAQSALKTVGLESFEKQPITQLSGGQQQKVLIAKALVANPDLLILDEPMTGIDRESEKEFLELLHHINKEHGKTIIIVTHNFEKIEGLSKIYRIEENFLKEVENV